MGALIKYRDVRILVFLGLLAVVLTNPIVAAAKELKCAIGQDKPPYVFGREKRGIEVDLVREALAYKGHTITITHFPNKRLQLQVPQGKCDCAVSVRITPDLEKNTYYSDPLVCFDI
jgi:polar amino acid transport system substrate-binding protein